MEQARNHAQMRDDPIGRWVAAGTSVVFCPSPTLCGVVVWGRPSADQVRESRALFDAYRHLAPRFDILLDAGAVERVEPDALAELMAWARLHWSELQQRMRSRAGVVPAGIGGMALAGITPLLGGTPVLVLGSLREAARALLPGDREADALVSELDAIVARVRGVPPLLARLRELLDGERGRLGVAGAARQLGVSTRSLQRELAQAGSSFRAEQSGARFRAAETLLASDRKLAAVAADLGLSEAGLTTLVRAHSGVTPGELRRRLR